MNEFLERFDHALDRAKKTGRVAWLTEREESKGPHGEWIGKLIRVGRTRHPAFIVSTPAKHDPERDQ